jgi:hypothetical protein
MSTTKLTTKKRSTFSNLSPAENMTIAKFLKNCAFNDITFPTEDNQDVEDQITAQDFCAMTPVNKADVLDYLESKVKSRKEVLDGAEQPLVFKNTYYKLTYEDAVRNLETIQRVLRTDSSNNLVA